MRTKVINPAFLPDFERYLEVVSSASENAVAGPSSRRMMSPADVQMEDDEDNASQEEDEEPLFLPDDEDDEEPLVRSAGDRIKIEDDEKRNYSQSGDATHSSEGAEQGFANDEGLSEVDMEVSSRTEVRLKVRLLLLWLPNDSDDFLEDEGDREVSFEREEARQAVRAILQLESRTGSRRGRGVPGSGRPSFGGPFGVRVS